MCGWICYVGNAKCLLASGRGRTSGEAGLLGPAEQHKLSSEHHNLKLETKQEYDYETKEQNIILKVQTLRKYTSTITVLYLYKYLQTNNT